MIAVLLHIGVNPRKPHLFDMRDWLIIGRLGSRLGHLHILREEI